MIMDNSAHPIGIILQRSDPNGNGLKHLIDSFARRSQHLASYRSPTLLLVDLSSKATVRNIDANPLHSPSISHQRCCFLSDQGKVRYDDDDELAQRQNHDLKLFKAILHRNTSRIGFVNGKLFNARLVYVK